MAETKIEEISPDAGLRRLTGDTGVFIGGESDLTAAAERYAAQKAYSRGTATPDQLAMLKDLDRVLQNAGSHLARSQDPVASPTRSAPPTAQVPTTSGHNAVNFLNNLRNRN